MTMAYACEPRPRLWASTLSYASWDRLDQAVSRAVGRRAVALPSVRVGLLWVLESLGLNRHKDEVLIPRYSGRCLLETFERVAHPSYELTDRTRAAVLVHFFGRSPDWASVLPTLERRGVAFMEDAPDALAAQEAPAPGSLGKFIALWKLLPCLKGACLVTDRPEIESVIKARRSARQGAAASWFVWAAALAIRGFGVKSQALAETMYALYPHAPGDAAPGRGGLLHALDELERYAGVEARRLERLRERLRGDLVEPDAKRLIRFVAVSARSERLAASLVRAGFCPDALHFDMRRNPLSPSFEKVHAIPVHPQIPDSAFDGLIENLEPVAHVHG